MIKRELTDESKSVSSLYNNIEIVLPNRCHEGPLLFKNPAKSGSSGPLKSFPLESQNVFFSDFVRFLCDFCSDNPAHTAIFDSPRDFCSQYVASGYYAFLVRLNLIIPFEPLFPTIKRKGVCLCQSFYHANSTSTPPASSCDMLTARFSASTLPASRTASIPP